MNPAYRGRFAPSPTGALHAGSLVAALASWLDARAHQGEWLVRIEDVDHTRCRAGFDQQILQQLTACGLHSDQPPSYQSQRDAQYQQALDQLLARGLAYPCACTRKEIAQVQQQHGQIRPRHGEWVYPGTCRAGLQGRRARAWRFRTDTAPATLHWQDRRLGPQQQDVQAEVGDFVLKRADGCFAYQLAVVVDDGEQGITDIVRGEDLCDNTARQICLQTALGLPRPRYLHTPLVLGANGEKLSKQNGALPIETSSPGAACAALQAAARVLGLASLPAAAAPSDLLMPWVAEWRARYVDRQRMP